MLEEQSSPAVIVSHAERCEPVVVGSGSSVKPKPCLRTVPSLWSLAKGFPVISLKFPCSR